MHTCRDLHAADFRERDDYLGKFGKILKLGEGMLHRYSGYRIWIWILIGFLIGLQDGRGCIVAKYGSYFRYILQYIPPPPAYYLSTISNQSNQSTP